MRRAANDNQEDYLYVVFAGMKTADPSWRSRLGDRSRARQLLRAPRPRGGLQALCIPLTVAFQRIQPVQRMARKVEKYERQPFYQFTACIRSCFRVSARC